MAIIKAVNSRASIANAINYITKTEKTEKKLITGIECSPHTAIEEMKATKEMWHKTDGRQYKHFIQSFSPDDKVTPEQAHKITCDLVKDRFKGYEILIATHKDKEHIHSHIIVNSVNYIDGHKLQFSKQDLKKMKEHSDELCRQNNLSICQKGKEISSYNLNKYKAIEKSVKENYKSYLVDTVLAVNNAKKQATSRQEFIKLMKQQGYEVSWSDTRKYITFTDKEGHKVRNSNLTKTFKEDFGKESLENEFVANRAREEEIINRRTESGKERENPDRSVGIGERGTETNFRELYERYIDIQKIGRIYSQREHEDDRQPDRNIKRAKRHLKNRNSERNREHER